MIDLVIQFSRLDIYRVYEMQADEFFSYIDYIRAREKKKADEIRRIQQR